MAPPASRPPRARVSVQVFNRQRTRAIKAPAVCQLTRELVKNLPPHCPVPWQDDGAGQENRNALSRMASPSTGAIVVGRRSRGAGPSETDLRPRRKGAGESAPLSGRLGVHLIAAAEMACLNEEFLGHAGSTDVITFNYSQSPAAGDLCGEIYISVDDAVAAAPRFRVAWPLELARYLAHGLLHLRGYDDQAPDARRVMKKWENRMLKDLSRAFNWATLEPPKHAARRK